MNIIHDKENQHFTIKINTSLFMKLSKIFIVFKLRIIVFVILLCFVLYNTFFPSISYYLSAFIVALTSIAAFIAFKSLEKHYIICTLILNMFFMGISYFAIWSNCAIPVNFIVIKPDLISMLYFHLKCFILAIIGVKIYLVTKRRVFE